MLAIIGALRMPEIGGKKFVTDFRSMIESEVQKALEDGRGIIREAVGELKDVIKDQSKGAARAIREQAQHIRDGMSDYIGNNPTDEELAAEAAAKAAKANGATETQTITAGEVGSLDPILSKSEGGTAS